MRNSLVLAVTMTMRNLSGAADDDADIGHAAAQTVKVKD